MFPVDVAIEDDLVSEDDAGFHFLFYSLSSCFSFLFLVQMIGLPYTYLYRLNLIIVK